MVPSYERKANCISTMEFFVKGRREKEGEIWFSAVHTLALLHKFPSSAKPNTFFLGNAHFRMVVSLAKNSNNMSIKQR